MENEYFFVETGTDYNMFLKCRLQVVLVIGFKLNLFYVLALLDRTW